MKRVVIFYLYSVIVKTVNSKPYLRGTGTDASTRRLPYLRGTGIDTASPRRLHDNTVEVPGRFNEKSGPQKFLRGRPFVFREQVSPLHDTSENHIDESQSPEIEIPVPEQAGEDLQCEFFSKQPASRISPSFYWWNLDSITPVSQGGYISIVKAKFLNYGQHRQEYKCSDSTALNSDFFVLLWRCKSELSKKMFLGEQRCPL